jgi:hypothetical protein
MDHQQNQSRRRRRRRNSPNHFLVYPPTSVFLFLFLRGTRKGNDLKLGNQFDLNGVEIKPKVSF